MKLKYIFASIVATLALAVSCEKEAAHYLNEIKVSSSYITFDAEGGDLSYTFTTTDAWEWALVNMSEKYKGEDGKDKQDPVAFPKWLKASVMSGAAGENTVVITAEAAEATRDAVIAISCAGKVQRINVIQTAEAVEPEVWTVEQIIALAPGLADGSVPQQTIRVKGIVCRIDEISTSYGNATFYISTDGSFQGKYDASGNPVDGANWFEVYRGYWLEGAKFTTGDEFGIGDEVVVEGLLISYKGTPETNQNTAYVVSYTKSLIAVDGPDYGTVKDEKGEEVALTAIPADGGEARLTVSSKVTPVLLTSDSAWLTVTDVKEGDVFVVHAEPNETTAIRTATITIKAPGAVKTATVTQDGQPVTGLSVTEIIALDDNSEVETLESTVVAKTTKGVVLWDGTNAVYLYGDKAAEVKIGDKVKAWGTKKTYNGVPEIELGKDKEAHMVTVVSSGNTFELPEVTDITANVGEYAATKAEFVKLTGTLAVSGTYYNLKLDAFEDGSKQGSIVSPVEDLNVASYADKKITVTGWFNGLSGGGKYVNVIATKIVEFQDNPKGSETNPYKPSEIAALLLGGTTPDENVYIQGIVSDIRFTFSADFGTATFWISDDGVANGVSTDHKSTTEPTKDFLCYGVYYGGAETKWVEGNSQVELGAIVTLCGKVKVYEGLAETDNKKAWVVSIQPKD